MIYGITGYKRHGKDTLAKLITKYNSDFNIDHFAGKLKEMCINIFNLTPYDIDEGKELLLKHPINIDEYIHLVTTELNINLPSLGLVADTPRKLMQYLGTEYVRNNYNNFWIDYLVNKVKDKNYVISDVRFINEAEAIKQLGGKIIRIIRPDFANKDMHISETEQINIKVDLEIEANTGEFDYLSSLAKLIAKDNFIEAKRVINEKR